jgi:hypothetical protein
MRDEGPKKKMGRIPKLETCPEISKFLVDAIAAGCPINQACSAAGISLAAFWRWLAEGEKANARPIYRNFRDAIKQGQRDRLLNAVQAIQAAAPRQWQAAAWWLERSSPENWASPETRLRQREIEAAIEDLRRQFQAKFPDQDFTKLLDDGGDADGVS